MTRKLRNSVTTNPWRIRKRVLPQHTDLAGVVWHGTHIAWLEEARVEALVAAGLSYSAMTELGIEMPVVSLRIDYRRSLRHGDLVDLESICGDQRGVRWPWCSRLLCGDDLIAEAQVELVMIGMDRNERRVLRRPPSPLHEVMNRLIAGPPSHD